MGASSKGVGLPICVTEFESVSFGIAVSIAIGVSVCKPITQPFGVGQPIAVAECKRESQRVALSVAEPESFCERIAIALSVGVAKLESISVSLAFSES